MDAAGNLYGAASAGGAAGDGTVFEIAKGSSTITAFASFSGSNRVQPASSLTFDAAGIFVRG
jgi:uncharacterized repeat protein (TIGR03803 family)